MKVVDKIKVFLSLLYLSRLSTTLLTRRPDSEAVGAVVKGVAMANKQIACLEEVREQKGRNNSSD